ncbi:hypothetical protein GGR57DRAFT_119817 [Xylariaceae sp. FL1272]|nr:hypothetical protein GGR57DRAFT_119817 [Xylariaceae sp. FL1272]
MEDMIKQSSLHVDMIGPLVQEGHYDLTGPNGEIILPQVWEKVIEPDWAITMHMWPTTNKPPPGPRFGLGKPVGGPAAFPGGGPNAGPPPGGRPVGGPPHRYHAWDEKKASRKEEGVGAFLGRKLQSLKRRNPTSSMTSFSSDISINS